jgi:hypothetical protein
MNILKVKVLEQTITRIDRATSIKINRIKAITYIMETAISRVTTTKIKIIMDKSTTTTKIPRIKTITTIIQIIKIKAIVS